MKYDFTFYTEEDSEGVEALILNAYRWEHPIFGLSRYEFSKGLHPFFTGIPRAWERTAGVYKEDGTVVACAINEADGDSGAFLLFDGKERSEDRVLIADMLQFSKAYMSSVKDDGVTRFCKLRVPSWNSPLKELAAKAGFVPTKEKERVNILPFGSKPFPVKLPEGYVVADGNTTPDFYLSNVHMVSFNYGLGRIKESERAFHELRRMKHYNKNLDLCVLDENRRPVAMAMIWVDEKMPYCELEPLGVAWWERRKGLATAILHEAANRVMKLYPQCRGMMGGDQPFYKAIGYNTESEIDVREWKTEIYASWDEKSADRDYSVDF